MHQPSPLVPAVLLAVLGLLSTPAFGAPAPAPATEPPTYRATGQLPGPPEPGWDYASIDPSTHRLFVTRGGTVNVFDLTGRDPARAIGAIDRGHAALPLPNNELLVTSGHDASVRLLDATTGRERARIAVGEGPDAAALDPRSGHVLVMNAEAGSVSEIDPIAARVVRTVPLKPGLESAVVVAGRLFVANEDQNEIETVDLASGAAGVPIGLAGCEGPTGLGFDAPSNRLIAACANQRAAIVDASAQRLASLLVIGEGPDAVLVDAARRRAFIPCGRSASLEIIALDAPQGPTRLAPLPTEPGARLGAVDPTTGAVYLPTARFGPLVPPAKRPPIVAGSFHLLRVDPH